MMKTRGSVHHMSRVKIRRRRLPRPRGLTFVPIKLYAIGLVLDPSEGGDGMTPQHIRRSKSEIK